MPGGVARALGLGALAGLFLMGGHASFPGSRLAARDGVNTLAADLIASMIGLYLFMSLWPVIFCKRFNPLYEEKMRKV